MVPKDPEKGLKSTPGTETGEEQLKTTAETVNTEQQNANISEEEQKEEKQGNNMNLKAKELGGAQKPPSRGTSKNVDVEKQKTTLHDTQKQVKNQRNIKATQKTANTGNKEDYDKAMRLGDPKKPPLTGTSNSVININEQLTPNNNNKQVMTVTASTSLKEKNNEAQQKKGEKLLTDTEEEELSSIFWSDNNVVMFKRPEYTDSYKWGNKVPHRNSKKEVQYIRVGTTSYQVYDSERWLQVLPDYCPVLVDIRLARGPNNALPTQAIEQLDTAGS